MRGQQGTCLCAPGRHEKSLGSTNAAQSPIPKRILVGIPFLASPPGLGGNGFPQKNLTPGPIWELGCGISSDPILSASCQAHQNTSRSRGSRRGGRPGAPSSHAEHLPSGSSGTASSHGPAARSYGSAAAGIGRERFVHRHTKIKNN